MFSPCSGNDRPQSGTFAHLSPMGARHNKSTYSFIQWVCYKVELLSKSITDYCHYIPRGECHGSGNEPSHSTPAKAYEYQATDEPRLDFYRHTDIRQRTCSSMEEFIETVVHQKGRNSDGTELTEEDAKSDEECINLYNHIHQKSIESDQPASTSRSNNWKSFFLTAMCLFTRFGTAAARPKEYTPCRTFISMEFNFDVVNNDHFINATYKDHPQKERPDCKEPAILMDSKNSNSQATENLMIGHRFFDFAVPDDGVLTIKNEFPPVIGGTMSLHRRPLLNPNEDFTPEPTTSCKITELHWDKGSQRIIRTKEESAAKLTTTDRDPASQNPPCTLAIPYSEPGEHAYQAEMISSSNTPEKVNVKFKIRVKPMNHLCVLFYTIGRDTNGKQVTVKTARYYLNDADHQHTQLNLIHQIPVCNPWKRIAIGLLPYVNKIPRQKITHCGFNAADHPDKKRNRIDEEDGASNFDTLCIYTYYKRSASLYMQPEANPDNRINFTVTYNTVLENGEDLHDTGAAICQKFLREEQIQKEIAEKNTLKKSFLKRLKNKKEL